MKKHKARTPEEYYERVKQDIINHIKLDIKLIEHDLAYCNDLDKLYITSKYNSETGQNELVNITKREHLQLRLEHAKKELENTEAIELKAYRSIYKFKKNLPKKDNSGYIDEKRYGGWYNDNRIRVPSLKRKTAWKRFYKMFPHLKGRKYFIGHSTGGAQRASFIKLKEM